MRHVVMFSFGIGSWAAAKRVAERHGTQDLTLLNADTLIEDEDTYKWGRAAAANVGGQLVTIADGRDPWQVFKDVRYLGNTRVDPCSKLLKREMCDRWLRENCDPQDTIVYLGIHKSEEERFHRSRERMRPWMVQAPLCDTPIIGYQELHDWARREGLWQQRLYAMGFPHANCGGFCIKGGHTHFKHLLKSMPERYAYHEGKEEELREHLGKDVAILRDRRGGQTVPLTLRRLRERVEAKEKVEEFDWGGCGCFSGEN